MPRPKKKIDLEELFAVESNFDEEPGFLDRAVPRVLFWINQLLAAVLVVLVLVMPLIARGQLLTGAWQEIATLLAQDSTVRRTALAAAFGLCVAACVFFRGPRSAIAK